MNIKDAMKARVSRRAFLGEPVDADVAERLLELMLEINREEGLNFRFIENGGAAFEGLSRSYGMFSGVRSVMVLSGRPDDPERKEKVGYFGERLVLEATAYGLGTCWVAGTFDRHSPALGVPEGDELECVIPVGKARGEASLRERIIHRMTQGRELLPEDIVDSDGELPQRVREGLEAVLSAPSAKNGRPVRFTWRQGRLSAAIPDTYHMQWVDLGIAKFHFELAAGGRFERGNGGVWDPEGTGGAGA